MTISDIIKELKFQNNLSQEQLGKLLDVTQQAVARWEAGAFPCFESILAIYNVFGMTPNELFGIEEPKTFKLKK